MAEATVPCTSCEEAVPIEETECPHCGKSFITRGQAKVMILVAYPIVLPVVAFLLASAIHPSLYDPLGFPAFAGLVTVLFYGSAAGYTWLLYRRRRRRIEEAVAATERA